jgi:unsaturated chondroitin disaccharide hydrolase
LKNFVRPDDSVFHAFRFDLQTGRPIGGDNYCGRSVDSHWARGTAWAIYGFALSYGYTHDRRYLDAALRLTRKFIANLDAEMVPVWDFRLPAGETPLRDASAAAVAVCGFQSLATHKAADALIVKTKERMMNRLCSDDYLDFDERCLGVLKHGIGNKEGYSSWGDYFLMEALAGELFQFKPYW